MAEVKPRARWIMPPADWCGHADFSAYLTKAEIAPAARVQEIAWFCNVPECRRRGVLIPTDADPLDVSSAEKAVVLAFYFVAPENAG